MTVRRPPEPPTVGIDRELRLAILNWGEQHRISPEAIWLRYARQEGHGTILGALSRVGVRYGLGESLSAGLKDELRERAEQLHTMRGGLTAEPGADDATEAAADAPRLALFRLPDEEFLLALESAPPGRVAEPPVSWTGRKRPEPVSVLDFAGELFARRGLPWSASAADGVLWHGHEDTQRPALDDAMRALTDPRLAAAADEWLDARRQHRAGDPKSLEDAVEESAKAVESVLKVLLIEHGIQAPRQQAAMSMFERLADPAHGAVLPGYLNSLVTAPANIRNNMGGHGAGSAPRVVSSELAQAALLSSATAIALLATYLP